MAGLFASIRALWLDPIWSSEENVVGVGTKRDAIKTVRFLDDRIDDLEAKNLALRTELRSLVRWCKTYMDYHNRKRAEGGGSPATGLWPAIRSAEATLGDPPEEEAT